MYVLLCYVGQADLCLEAKLEQFSHDVDTFDVIINHSPVFPLEKFYLPYIGSFLPCDTIANAVYACRLLSLFLCYKLEFCRNGWTNRAGVLFTKYLNTVLMINLR